jgi:RNA polymerase sigma factor (sigma-70 family)
MIRENETIKALFQKEFSKMVAVISRRFGLPHIEIAEDIVSETFLLAIQNWEINGIPPNPTAWLYKSAQRKTLYHFRRAKILEQKIIPALSGKKEDEYIMPELDFSSENIKDSQLRMLFAVCNPAIASEAQIGLALRILCGFGIDEIAEAFFSNKQTINKRLLRAKEKLRAEKIKMELPAESEINERLDNVLHIIYLLFNEGYYSKTQNQILRRELCFDALRLGKMLTEYERTNRPRTNALLALMCFHASRFSARQTENNSFILYEDQDEELWDDELIGLGSHFLALSAGGDEISSYHIEARIACWHCMKADTAEKWRNILHLYDRLLLINYSPGAALNRTFALYKVEGLNAALAEMTKLKLENNHFYFILLGELYEQIDVEKAKLNYQIALDLSLTTTEKQILQIKINRLG